MKNTIPLVFILFLGMNIMSAQVGINTTEPDENAALDIESTTRGVLIPRMTDAQVATLEGNTPPNGMLVYNTDQDCVQLYTGTSFECLTVDSGTDKTDDAWENNNDNSRVELSTQSDGSTTRTAGTEVVIKDDGKVGIGTSSPVATLQVKNGDFRLENDDNWNAYKGVTYSNNKYPQLFLFKARGTKASPSYPQSGNTMGVFRVANAIDSAGGAGFRINATELQTASAHGSSLIVFTTPNGQNNNQDRFIVDHNGNVGIGMGIISPTVKLDVQTDESSNYVPIANFFAPSNNVSGNKSQLRLGVNNSTKNAAEIRFNYIGSGSNSNSLDFSFGGIASSLLSIQAGGNVGIGESNPSAKLEVNGNLEISTVNAVSNDNEYKPLVWNTNTHRVETTSTGGSLRKITTSVSSSGGSTSITTLTSTSAYEVTVYVETDCNGTLYNKFVVTGGNLNGNWVLNYIGGASQNGPPVKDASSTKTTAVMLNPYQGGCGGDNNTSFNYTLSVGASTGTLTITNNGNVARVYRVLIEKMFD